MRIITGALAFFARSTGITSEIAPVILLPNPPPVYSLTTTTSSGGTPTQRDDAEHGLRGALRARVDVNLPVLPVRHRRPGLERLVAGVGRDEGFVEHERGFLEASLEVAVRPGFRCALHHRQAAGVGLGQFRRRPLHFTDLGTRRALRLAALPAGAGGGMNQ